MTENVQFLKDLRKMAQMQDQYGQEEPQYWVAGEYRGAASVERNRNISTEYQPNKTMFLTKESAVIARYRLAGRGGGGTYQGQHTAQPGGYTHPRYSQCDQ